MLHLFTDLPWQHNLLLVDAVVSALWAMVWMARGGFTVRKRNVLFVLWDASLIGLLVWGADHTSWQYLTLGVLYLFAVLNGTFRLLTKQGEWIKLESTKGAVPFLWLYLVGITLLVVTG